MFRKELFLVGVLAWGGWVGLRRTQTIESFTKPEPRLVPARRCLTLAEAVMLTESRGNLYAVGDKHLRHWAYGPFQVRQPVVDDLNRLCGTELRRKLGRTLQPKDFLGRVELSVWAFEYYTRYYATRERLGRAPTDEDRARIWNGGPNGYKNPRTVRYWKKVQSKLKGV